VSRVGSTGGGRNYRSRRPINFYGVIAVIVVLGTLSVLWASHDYRNSGVSSSSTTPPLAGTTSFAALGIDVCGTLQPNLPPAGRSTGPLVIGNDGVVKISPATKAQAGDNANVQRMALTYPGLRVSTGSLTIPSTATSTSFHLVNGDSCPKGTADAGQTGSVVVGYWSNFADKNPELSSDPSTVRLTANSLVTIAFVPTDKTPLKASQSTITAMLSASQSGSTTPTTAPATTTTTATTSTTAATTTTTAK
jgi:hypothetical protein